MQDQEREIEMLLFAEGCPKSYITYLLYRGTLYISRTERYGQNITVYSTLTPSARAMLSRAVENLNVPAWESADSIRVMPESSRQVRMLSLRFANEKLIRWLAEESAPDFSRATPLLLLLRQFPTQPVSRMIPAPKYRLTNAFGEHYPIDRTPFYIGRRSELFAKFLGMTLAGPDISRIHAALVMKEDRLYLCDADSANGTYYNGAYLPPGFSYRVKAGGEIRIGDTLLLIEEIDADKQNPQEGSDTQDV